MKAHSMNKSVFAQRFWYFIVSLILGALLSIAASLFLPCNWFGTSFEGSCGIAIYSLTVFFGLILGLVIFVWFYRMTAKRKNETPQASDEAIRRYTRVFWICFVLYYVAAIADWLVGYGLCVSMLAGIIWTAVELSVRMKRSALAPLAVFVPVIGCCVVAWILFNDKLLRKERAAKSGE